MAISLSLRGDLKKLTRHLTETQRKVIPTVAAQALNEVARIARTEGIKEAARELRLTPTLIRKRFDKDNKVKGDRIYFVRATRSTPVAKLEVYNRGIPVFQIAGIQNKQGVKAQGGRLYVGAFKAKGLVFKRRGKERKPLFLPKVSVQKTLESAFSKRMVGTEGRRAFTQAFTTRLAARLRTLRA